MSKLIDELKNEHELLASNLVSIKSKGSTSTESKKELFDAKNMLLNHLKKEDNQLYPILNKAAETNKELKNTLDIFAKDMNGISKTALGFFEKYEKESTGMDFAKDLGLLISALSNRIRKEENILYNKFDEIKL